MKRASSEILAATLGWLRRRRGGGQREGGNRPRPSDSGAGLLPYHDPSTIRPPRPVWSMALFIHFVPTVSESATQCSECDNGSKPPPQVSRQRRRAAPSEDAATPRLSLRGHCARRQGLASPPRSLPIASRRAYLQCGSVTSHFDTDIGRAPPFESLACFAARVHHLASPHPARNGGTLFIQLTRVAMSAPVLLGVRIGGGGGVGGARCVQGFGCSMPS